MLWATLESAQVPYKYDLREEELAIGGCAQDFRPKCVASRTKQ
jgi:hypothetical protein